MTQSVDTYWNSNTTTAPRNRNDDFLLLAITNNDNVEFSAVSVCGGDGSLGQCPPSNKADSTVRIVSGGVE